MPVMGEVAPLREWLGRTDQMFVELEEPAHYMFISAIFLFDSHVPSFADTKEVFQTWVTRFPMYKHKLQKCGGRYRWIPDESFNIANHVSEVTLPKGNQQRHLEEYCSARLSEPTSDRNKPLWKIFFVHNHPATGDGGAVFMLQHHSLTDGQGAVRTLLSLLSSALREEMEVVNNREVHRKHDGPIMHAIKTRLAVLNGRKQAKDASQAIPVEVTKGTRHDQVRSRQRHSKKTVVNAQTAATSSDSDNVADKALYADIRATIAAIISLFGVLASIPLLLIRVLWETVLLLLKYANLIFYKRRLFRSSYSARKQMAFSEPIPLDDVKAVGKALNATINDVIMHCLTGCLRTHLLEQRTLGIDGDIKCLVPISLRSLDDWTPGNQLCLGLISLPVTIESPFKRFQTLRKTTNRMKRSWEIPIINLGMQLILRLPMPFRAWVMKHFKSQYHVLMTNVPGPRTELRLAGVPVSSLIGIAPQPSPGTLGLAVVSYNGKIFLSVTSDADYLKPDPSHFLATFKRDFEELKALVHNTGR